MDRPYPHLLAPITLAGVMLRNRVIMGSMHTGLEETGDWPRIARFYAARARGGAGLIVTGGMAPNAEGAVMPGAAGLFSAADIAKHRTVTDAVHGEGGRIAMQILHAGRYAWTDKSVAPSPLRAPITPFTPLELDEAGIEKQIADFVTAALRAREAGYDGVEIMGSEGYFINEFLARRTNRRTDGWGRDWPARKRLALEIVGRTRRALGPDFLIIYRLSLADLVPEGQDWAEVTDLGRDIAAAGASLINSGFGWHEARVPTIAAMVPRGAFVPLTARLRAEVPLPVVASNRINTPELAEAILARGEADLVSMARPFLADPDFVAKAAAGRSAEIAPCIACNQACLDHTFALKLTSCLVNPAACHEGELALHPAARPRRIAVAGAGPAGLAAALTAARRGHHVTLFETSDRVGGQLNLAARIPGKGEFRTLLAWYGSELARLGIDLRLNTTAGPGLLAGFDDIILATGVRPRDPAIPAEPGARVATYADILEGRVRAGRRVVVIGSGGIGVDVALFLSEAGAAPDFAASWGIVPPWQSPGGLADPGPEAEQVARQVTILHRSSGKIGEGLGKTTGWIHRETLRRRGVRIEGGLTYHRIAAGGVLAGQGRGEPRLFPADTVVLCAGQVEEAGLALSLAEAGIRAHVVGGAARAAGIDAKLAIDGATRLAATL
jgi:2,4-dienoyl-CoA reductase (NADPH2)